MYTNGAALITALICMAAIYAVQRWVNPKFKRKFKMPLPIELIVVCIPQILSVLYHKKFEFASTINVTIFVQLKVMK